MGRAQQIRICSVLGTPTAASWPDGFKLASQLLGKHKAKTSRQIPSTQWFQDKLSISTVRPNEARDFGASVQF